MDVFERVDYYLRGEMSAIDGFEKYKEHPEGREIYETLVSATKSNFERINHFNYNGKQVEKRALYYFLGKDFCNVENTLIDCDDVLSSFNETPIFKPLKIFLAEFNTSCFYGVAAMPWSCRRLTFSKKGDLTLRLMALVSDNSFPSHIIEKMIDVALIELKIVNNDKLINKHTTVSNAPKTSTGRPKKTNKIKGFTGERFSNHAKNAAFDEWVKITKGGKITTTAKSFWDHLFKLADTNAIELTNWAVLSENSLSFFGDRIAFSSINHSGFLGDFKKAYDYIQGVN